MAQPRFGDLLRHYRQVAGFSQQHLAEKARMSVNAVSLLERGVRRAPHSTRQANSRRLRCERARAARASIPSPG